MGLGNVCSRGCPGALGTSRFGNRETVTIPLNLDVEQRDLGRCQALSLAQTHHNGPEGRTAVPRVQMRRWKLTVVSQGMAKAPDCRP